MTTLWDSSGSGPRTSRNRGEAEKDAADREAIVASLRRALKAGDKVLVGNRGYRRFPKAPEAGFVVDEQRAAEDARFDGIFVLSTNTERLAKVEGLSPGNRIRIL